ncbi:hypothetical protein WJX72_008964 [[Myrmecia] bisecta]|uniref:ADP-ribosylation factor-like protein 6-interacting protein 4 n=1 Tax=[Myrmecia] bisecta TaxID=41462 RepID=A0AAW1R972_9CHLO
MGSGSKEPKGPKHKSKKSKHSKKDHRLKAKKKSHKADKRKRKERSTSASSRSASRSPQRRRPISPDRSGEPLAGWDRCTTIPSPKHRTICGGGRCSWYQDILGMLVHTNPDSARRLPKWKLTSQPGRP